MLSGTLRTPNPSQVKNMILRALAEAVDGSLRRATIEAQDNSRQYTRTLMYNSLFYNAMVNSDLRGDFGIRPSEIIGRLDGIIDGIANDTHILFQPITIVGNDLVGGWTLAMGTDLFEKLKQISEGITVTEKNVKLHWLAWTLEEGDRLLISDFKIHFQTGRGRSGLAIMVPDNLATGWRVPNYIAGTDYDNWITREVVHNLKGYNQILINAIRNNI
jgi:hypothetical protein